MKKLLLSIVVVLCAMTVSAQSYDRFRFGVTGGMNISTTTSEVAEMKVGYNVGAKGEFNLTDEMYLNASILFDMKGATSNDIKINAGYLNIPVHFGYRFNITESLNLFAEVGPYFAFGVAGSTEGIKTFDYWNTFDLGLGAKVGAEFSGFQIALGCDYGLTKLADVKDGATNLCIAVGVAYMF